MWEWPGRFLCRAQSPAGAPLIAEDHQMQVPGLPLTAFSLGSAACPTPCAHIPSLGSLGLKPICSTRARRSAEALDKYLLCKSVIHCQAASARGIRKCLGGHSRQWLPLLGPAPRWALCFIPRMPMGRTAWGRAQGLCSSAPDGIPTLCKRTGQNPNRRAVGENPLGAGSPGQGPLKSQQSTHPHSCLLFAPQM